MGKWNASSSRGIYGRLFVRGTLELVSDAHFGNGDEAEGLDMPLLVDESSQGPLLPGTGLAGALRNFLREMGEDPDSLMGSSSGKIEQSALIVEDAFGEVSPAGPSREWRGHARDPQSGTVADGALYNFQTWQPGTKFKLLFELPILEPKLVSIWAGKLPALLRSALSGLHAGEGGITLGAKKCRGYGQVQVVDWEFAYFDFQSGLQAIRDYYDFCVSGKAPWNSLDVKVSSPKEITRIEGEFWLVGGAMFGASATPAGGVARTHEKVLGKPVMPAKEWTSAVRNHADRLVRVKTGEPSGSLTSIVIGLFGSTKCASRIRTTTGFIEKSKTDLEVSGILIDRLTNSVLGGGKFDYNPTLGDPTSKDHDATVRLVMEIRDATPAELGLILSTYFDLAVGVVPVGGLVNRGYGTLHIKGLTVKQGNQKANYTFKKPEYPLDPPTLDSNGADQGWISDALAEFETIPKGEKQKS